MASNTNARSQIVPASRRVSKVKNQRYFSAGKTARKELWVTLGQPGAGTEKMRGAENNEKQSPFCLPSSLTPSHEFTCVHMFVNGYDIVCMI